MEYIAQRITVYPNFQGDTPTTGTVTSVSVNIANGFGGTVANPTTTPAISIQTSVTGILKGNGIAVSAASGADIISSNVLSLAGQDLKSTIDGIDSNTVTIPSGANTNTLVNNLDNTLTSTVDGIDSTADIIITATPTKPDTNHIAIAVNGVGATQVAIIDTVTNSAALNHMSVAVNGVTGTSAQIVTSTALSLSGPNLTTTVNGVASLPLDLSPIIPPTTTNTLVNNGNNTFTSTVNGVASTDDIITIVGVARTFPNTISVQVNGQDSGPVDIIDTNVLSLSANLLKSTINGLDSNTIDIQIPIASPTNNNLVTMDATGHVKDALAQITTSAASNDNAHVMTSAAVQTAIASSPSGSVSSVSVVTANGFAGTVATPTTMPAITMSTSVTGILKGNGTAVSAAVATDIPITNTLSLVANALTSTVNGAASGSVNVQTLISTPTVGDIVTTNSSGQGIDSGVQITTSAASNDNAHVMTSAAVQTGLATKEPTISNLPVTKGGTGQGTANAAFNALAPNQASNANKMMTTDGTNSSWESLAGTTNQVTITQGSGVKTFSLPQNINSTAAPTFASVTLSNAPSTVSDATRKDYVDSAVTGVKVLPNSDIFVGNASNVATAVPVTGDISLANTGAITLARVPSGVATTFSSGVMHSNGTSLTSSLIVDADVSASAAIAVTKLAALTVKGAVTTDASGKLVATALADGKILIGSTGNIPAVAAITGTTNRVTVTNSPGAITLSGPQDINTTATPTFTSATLSGMLISGKGGSLATVDDTGLITPSFALNILKGYKLSWASNTTLGLTAGSANAFDFNHQTGGSIIYTQTGNVVINIANVGVVNGLDIGSAANSTNYYAYAIFHGTTTSLNGGMLSTVSPVFGPNLPSGYVASRYVGRVRRDGSGNFIPFVQSGEITRTTTFIGAASATQVLSGGTSASFTSLALSTFIPPGVNRGVMRFDYSNTSSFSTINFRDTGSSITSTNGLISFGPGLTAAFRGVLPFICNNSQSIDYLLSSAGDTANLYVFSYEEDL